jgi:hypothetical protein
MSWCDRLASTPTAGFRLEPQVSSGDSIVDSLSPIMARYVDLDSLRFQIERHDTLGVTFNTHDGYRYSVDQSKISLEFNHRIKVVPVSGGTPTLEMLSTAQPYTSLLPTVFNKLIEATLLLPKSASRQLWRVGVVSDTIVDEEDLPPGIARLIEYLAKPWGDAPKQYTYNAYVPLGSGASWKDECIYTISKPSPNESTITLKFDWGRAFDPPRKSFEDDLRQISKHAQSSALEFFEDLAEGSRFDAELIGTV